MNEPTREECERMFLHLKGDPMWQLKPVVDGNGVRVGYTALYTAGGRTFATPVFKAPVDRAVEE